MESQKSPAIFIAIGVAILGIIAIGWLLFNWDEGKISSFAQCEAAGYPIMESYPRQCRTDGQTFVEDVGEPSDPNSGDAAICVNSCGDGTCAEIVCLGSGCPCAETASSCPADCSGARE